MRDYVGVIELKHTIPCRKEVSGQTYKSKIAVTIIATKTTAAG